MQPVDVTPAARVDDTILAAVAHLSNLPVGVELQPVAVAIRRPLVPRHRGVNGTANIAPVQCLDLFAEQVAALQTRMHFADLGRIVAQAVMASRKQRDRIDARIGHRIGECFRIKIGPHPFDQRRGVKVEMHLAAAVKIVNTSHGIREIRMLKSIGQQVLDLRPEAIMGFLQPNPQPTTQLAPHSGQGVGIDPVV